MFVATVINFILSGLSTGDYVCGFIVFIRQALTLDINYPLSEKPELIDHAVLNVDIIRLWTSFFPVSIKLPLSGPVSIHARWRSVSAISLSFGGLGPSFQINSG